MTIFANWMPPNVMQALGWTLVHFLWQGVVVAALASLAMAVSRAARTRYALAVGALILVVAMPVGTFFFLWNAQSVGAMSASPALGMPSAQASAILPPASAPLLKNSATASLSQKFSASSLNLPPWTLMLLVEAWFAGVVLFSLRYAGGILLIERLRRKDAMPVSTLLLEKCMAMQRALGLDRVIRYCECYRIEAPAVIGWFRPMVLLPAAVLTGLTEDQLSAVIAHELAHIQRLDSFVNLFQVAAETLLFYHPAIWWVNKRIRAERENCCDDAAISVCGDALVYARALTLMAERHAAPTLAMALNRSPLEARVMRLLGIGNFRGRIRTVGFAASFLCLAGAVFAGNAFLNSVNYSLSPVAAAIPSHEVRSASPIANAAIPKSVVSTVFRNVLRTALQTAVQTAAQETQSSNQVSKESYIESLKAAGLQNLTVDEIVALKTQQVTADYVRSMVDLQLKVDVDTLVAMKVQGITADYVKEMRGVGLKVDADALVGMKVQQVTPEYVKEMRDAGLNGDADTFVAMKVQGITPDYVKSIHDMGWKLDADEMVGLKVQGITPEYVKEMRAAGLDGDADMFIAMKVQGITPEYVKSIHDMGWKPDADEMVGLKVQGVTPEYVKEMRAAGLDGDADMFIAMKVQGVTPVYAKEVHDLGLKAGPDDLVGMRVQQVTPDYIRAIRATGINPDGDEFIAMKVQGVTPEYIKALQAAGLKDLQPDDFIAAKVQGITPEFIEQAHKHGFQDLDLEKLLALKRAGVF